MNFLKSEVEIYLHQGCHVCVQCTDNILYQSQVIFRNVLLQKSVPCGKFYNRDILLSQGRVKFIFFTFISIRAPYVMVKDRHQWWRLEFRCSLSLSIDKLLPMAIK